MPESGGEEAQACPKEERAGHCAECGDYVAADGVQSGVMGGRLICRDCSGVQVAFVVECLDCDWEYRCQDRTTNKYDARMRVQQEGNNHETEMDAFEDESHETAWREVEP